MPKKDLPWSKEGPQLPPGALKRAIADYVAHFKKKEKSQAKPGSS